MSYFYESIISWIENEKLKKVFSDKNKPDVIITDKNQMAVVLKYNSKTMAAPMVLEKGRNYFAEKIIGIANNKKIPIVENKELAGDLYLNLSKGQEILSRNYQGIANIYFANDISIDENNRVDNHNCFAGIFEVQRQACYERLYIKPPEKIQLELSKNVFSLIEDKVFRIDLNGMLITNIKVEKNIDLTGNDFCVKLYGNVVKHGEIKLSNIDPFDQLTLHLSETLKSHSTKLIGRDEVVHFLGQLKERYPVLVQDVMNTYSIREIKEILNELLRENVPMRNIVVILETMADFENERNNIELVVEKIRIAIGRDICNSYLDDKNILKMISFENEFDRLIKTNKIYPENDRENKHKYSYLLCQEISNIIGIMNNKGIKPVVICSPSKRKQIRNIIEKFNRDISVLSAAEIPKEIKIEEISVLKHPASIIQQIYRVCALKKEN